MEFRTVDGAEDIYWLSPWSHCLHAAEDVRILMEILPKQAGLLCMSLLLTSLHKYTVSLIKNSLLNQILLFFLLLNYTDERKP